SLRYLIFLISFHCSASLLILHSFPTRRSSDLAMADQQTKQGVHTHETAPHHDLIARLRSAGYKVTPPRLAVLEVIEQRGEHLNRSEEHTSELQSRENLVCRLLLEKKK